MLPSDFTRVNQCFERLSSLPIPSHTFITNLKRRQQVAPSRPLSSGERKYLMNLHNKLVEQGLVDQLAA